MDKKAILEEIRRWSIDDRIRVVEILWDSIAAENPKLPDGARRERLRRIEEHCRDPSIGIPAEDVFREIEHSLE